MLQEDVDESQSWLARLVQGDEGSAIANCTQAIEVNPDDASAFWTRSSVCRNLGKLNEALADFHPSLELQPNMAI
jgi:Flp pilus assembly protein TadD